MPMAVLSLLSQGYPNIIPSARLLQPTACYIKKKTVTKGGGTTYASSLQNVFFLQNGETNTTELVILTRNTMDQRAQNKQLASPETLHLRVTSVQV